MGVSGGDECLPFLQMGQHCSGSYTGFTHSGTAQSDTTQWTSLFGSQRHHSQGEGCEQRRRGGGMIRVRQVSQLNHASHAGLLEKKTSRCIILDACSVSSQTGSDIMRGSLQQKSSATKNLGFRRIPQNHQIYLNSFIFMLFILSGVSPVTGC